MFIIRKKQWLHRVGTGARMTLTRAFVLLALPVLVGISGIASAQCTLETSGYLFLHPFFKNSNWEASIYTTSLFAEKVCAYTVSHFSVHPDPDNGTTIFTTADSTWYISQAPLVQNSSVCSRPEIQFSEPVALSLPGNVSLNPAIPFIIRDATIADTAGDVSLIAASGNNVYLMHCNAVSGACTVRDSLYQSSEVPITGVWSPEHQTSDTVWITGANGLITASTIDSGTFTGAIPFSSDENEQILCTDGQRAGTASGKIFVRDDDSFSLEKDLQSGALRYISGTIATGDSGTVAVLRNNDTWELRKKGTANYRYGHLVGTTPGTAAELIDDSWSYSSSFLYDTPSSITATSPEAVADSGLNNGRYEYTATEEPFTVRMTIADPDNNRKVPAIWIDSDSTRMQVSDSLLVGRQNPAAICTTQQTLFHGSSINIVLQKDRVSIQIPVLKSINDAGCQIWKWQNATVAFNQSWVLHDMLLIAVETDTLRIRHALNTVQAQYNRPGLLSPATTLKLTIGSITRSIPVQDHLSPSEIIISDLAGRSIRRHLDAPFGGQQNQYSLPRLAPGVHLVTIVYKNGTRNSSRIIVPGH